MNTNIIIGAVLVCLVAGLAIGYLIGNLTYTLPPEDTRQTWATLYIDAGVGTLNYTAKYQVYWQYGVSIPKTTIIGPTSTSLNITRPNEAPAPPLTTGGWTIEVWAKLTPYNGITPEPTDIVTIVMHWGGPHGSWGSSYAYGTYPSEAHIKIYLS